MSDTPELLDHVARAIEQTRAPGMIGPMHAKMFARAAIDAMPKHPLIGLIAGFREFVCEHTYRAAGRGIVKDALPGGSLLLVETIAREGDDEPAHMMVIDATEPELRFHATLEEEQAWYDWVMQEASEKVVRLVPTKPEPERA